MALYLYDEAFLNKLKSWSKNTNLHILGPDDTQKLFQIQADENGDNNIQLPSICLRLLGGFEILNTNKQPLTYDGFTKEATIPKSLQLNVVPVNIRYQLDIYTRYFKEADEYMRNLIFNIINYPKLLVEVPYNDIHFKHNAIIRIASDVIDNSDIPERLVSGQFSRFTLQINIDDAYIWDVRLRDNYIIDPIVEVD